MHLLLPTLSPNVPTQEYSRRRLPPKLGYGSLPTSSVVPLAGQVLHPFRHSARGARALSPSEEMSGGEGSQMHIITLLLSSLFHPS